MFLTYKMELFQVLPSLHTYLLTYLSIPKCETIEQKIVGRYFTPIATYKNREN